MPRSTDFLLIRPDGVGVIDAREVIAREDGATAAVHARGLVIPPVPMPDLTPPGTLTEVDLDFLDEDGSDS